MSEGDTITVMIVDDIADTCDQLEKLLFFEKDIEVVAKAGNGREAVARARELKPDVILMDINMPEMDGIAATEAIVSEDASVQVIIMSVQGETDYLRKAMMAGAREFLVKPVSADDLYKSIRHVYKLGQTRPRMVAQTAAVDTASSAEEHGDVFAVYSPKGGAGTSVIAANLAIALRQMTQKRVVLVDGNLNMGDLNVILNMVSNRTIVDLADRLDDLDSELLNDVLGTHTSQIKVLLAPTNPQDGELVTAEHLKLVISALRNEFDYVIIDTQSSFHDRALAVMDLADRIIVLMTQEMTCIKNIKLFMEITDLLGYARDKLLLVLNKADSRLRIRVENVESNIKHKVVVQIPDAAHEMTVSINQGVPMVIDHREHRTSKGIYALARELSQLAEENKAARTDGTATKPAAKPKAKQGGLFGRIFG